MTDDLKRAAKHKVLPAELIGDTLVIAPRGPLSQFSASQVSEELRRVKEILQNSKVRNALFDLSASKYFGTPIVNAIEEVRPLCPDGITAVCNVSDDMEVAFELCQDEYAQPVYKSRRNAMRQVAKIPFTSRILPRSQTARRILVPILLMSVVWGAWASKVVYQITGSTAASEYRSMLKIYEAAQETRSMEEHANFLHRADRTLSRIEAIEHGATRDAMSLSEAAATLKTIVHNPQLDGDEKFSFMHHMHVARVSLHKRTGLNVPAVKRTSQS